MRYFAVFIACIGFLTACGANTEPKTEPVLCDAAKDICLSKTEVLHCVGDQRIREYCPTNELCFEGKCKTNTCEPNEILECRENGQFYGCNPVGTGYGDFDCPTGLSCVQKRCEARICKAGSGRCVDDETIALCNEAGTAYSNKQKCQDLRPKSICQNDACTSICEQTSKEASYIGCEYWAVDLDNAIDAGVYDAAGQAFAVVLSNTHESLPAAVDIFIKENGKVKTTLSFEIPSQSLRKVFLPDACYYKGQSCLRAYSVNGTVITDTAYRIVSDLPITAAQFNPLDNVDVYSNDGSLLFPTSALGKRYMVMTRAQHYTGFRGFVTITAVEDGETKVSFKTTCNTVSGLDKAKKPIAAMNTGDTQHFTLQQYDILNIETRDIGDDLTGSLVTADKNVAVFAGVEATSLPETKPVTCCADHIEHQQYPLSAWGKRYNAVKLKPRRGERDIWRILARENGTIVTTTPSILKDDIQLDAGQWIDILTKESFNIEANHPVLLGQFMTSQNDPHDPDFDKPTPQSAGIGDPAYLIGVPVEQYRSQYTFLTPSDYAEDYVTIIAPKGATVTLDGKPVPNEVFFTFGDEKYKAAYIKVEDGRHDLSASLPVGLFSYGYDNYVSYGYPAGLDLKKLFDE